jgi:S1-C subfamily serine protease
MAECINQVMAEAPKNKRQRGNSIGSVGFDAWSEVIDAVKPAVVELRVTVVRSFQDDTAGAHGGTGFVVDAEQGLILTNRHVASAGPCKGVATFVGFSAMEEVPVSLAYLDPTHDFAILRFDPKLLKRTPHAQIALAPEECLVGEDIRIIGNDALEKLQILSGTIARIDRNCPDLDGDFSDEMTFYVLAATGSTGGSSGSPVINCSGKAVALNAAARQNTMHALYLPLWRVVRALEAVQNNKLVSRGTLRTSFLYTPFPECYRLGVQSDFVQDHVLSEASTTFHEQKPGGMLKVASCLSGSSAESKLQPGDVLIKLQGKPCVDYIDLEAVLDDNVGSSVELEVCRNGRQVVVSIQVDNLHELIPHAFIELGCGVFHNVSYHTAKKHHVKVEGIQVAQAGFVFGEALKSDAVVLAVNGESIKDLDGFVELMSKIPDKEYFSVSWILPNSKDLDRRQKEDYAKMQQQWGPFRRWNRNRSTFKWEPSDLVAAPPATEMEVKETPESAETAGPADTVTSTEGTAAEAQADGTPTSPSKRPAASPTKKPKRLRTSGATGPLAMVEDSLCSVQFRVVQLFDTDLVTDAEEDEVDVIVRRGMGMIIDSKQGLVITDRNTVPQPLGDIEVTFGGTTYSASVVYVHPLHSLVLLQVDSKAPLGQNARCVVRKFEVGEELTFVGVDSRGQRFAKELMVAGLRFEEFNQHQPPRWHERNLEAVTLVDAPDVGGVLCDARGRILAFAAVTAVPQDGQLAKVAYGIPARVFSKLVETVISQGVKSLAVPSLELTLKSVDIQKLMRLPKRFQPPQTVLDKLKGLGKTALQVSGVDTRGPCDGGVHEGDVIVAISGKEVATAQGVDARLEELLAEQKETLKDAAIDVTLTVLRHGEEKPVPLRVPLLGTDGAQRIVTWQGLVLQETPRCVLEHSGVPKGIFASRTLLGSPGDTYQMQGDFLVAVDEVPTPTLDALLTLPKPQEGKFLRVESVDLRGQRHTTMLSPDQLFWPTTELACDSAGKWRCIEHK